MEETTFEVYGPHCCCSSAWREEARGWKGERKMKGRGEGSRIEV